MILSFLLFVAKTEKFTT